ncbi:hemerythrin domain-containing protein [Stieleria sp. TO1_6]|uniref:hemerythrin domain-containing protein n=1 Tax=Stieleria tagensis TaxID=2956795 RepID=UPI00209AD122|nr:hemerythrin domain-containing protein [Stieleria tagensis]MCO8121558.1 hemerythrin domain-containing protein [Stieleria tagensis]
MSDTLVPSTSRPVGAIPGESFLNKPAVGSLAVNAAFLKEIKDDNRHLKSLWDRMLPQLSHQETAKNHWSELIADVAELRDQLAIHFSLEEAYGYFDDALDIEPQISLTAESLKSQHPRLFAEIRDLADQMMELNGERVEHIQKWLRKFDRFRKHFEQHEEDELKLILHSFDDDLGVCD